MLSHGLLMADTYSSLQSQLPISYHCGYFHKTLQHYKFEVSLNNAQTALIEGNLLLLVVVL